MTLKGEITALEHRGDGIKITCSNIKKVTDPSWAECNPDFSIYAPLSAAKAFYMGRTVKITVKPS